MVYCVTLLNLYFCFVFLICSAALANLEKAWFGLDRIELAQCRLIGFTQIVTVVTSVVPTFFSCIALFGFVSFAFRFLVLLALLDCAGGFRSCGSDHGLCPLDSHKPLKRLDRNFKCFGTVTFVWLIGFRAVFPPRLLSLGSRLIWARLKK